MDADARRGEADWLLGGTMGALIRAHDWSRTPLGPVGCWPQSLRTVVNLMLAARQPVYIAWGPELASLYNEHYIPILGTKHPECLGKPYREVWAEIWEEFRPVVQATMAGEAQHFVDRPVNLVGRANLPASWFTFSWTPLRDETGAIAGFFCAATETTAKMRAEETLREHQEAALRASEERFGALVRASSQVMYRMSPDWSEMHQLSGGGFLLDTAAPIRDWLEKYIDPDDRPRCLAAIQEAIRTKRPFELEHQARRADGTLGWVHSRAVPILGPDGAIKEWFGIASDVTARKEAEAALRRSEERLRRAMETKTVGVIFFDPAGTITEANDAFLSFSGFTREDVAAGRLQWKELTPPEHMPASWSTFNALMTTGRAPPYEKEYFRKDGSRWWGLFAPRLLAEGEAVEFIIEITERKGMEAALRTSEERYRGLVETQADLVVRIGADGRFTFVNDTACRAFGRSREELLSIHWLRFVHPDDADAILAAIDEAKTSPDHRTTVEARILTVNGIRWYAWEGYAIFNEAGVFVEKQSVGRDITERKAIEDALRHAKDEAERAQEAAELATLAKSKFLAAASHDLRQPMQSLLLFLDVLKPHVAPKGQEAMKHLGRGLDALRDLLDSLLDISRLDAGIVEPVIADFAIEEFLGEIGAAYKPVAAAKGIAFQVAACAAVARSDHTLLGRMVRNLVENALRYTEAGRIALECHVTKTHLRIEVQDTGIGIPPEYLEWVWQEFHQVDNPERDRNRGLGLGLSIVQRLSTLLKHPVHVRSTPGEGSVFSIDVPHGDATAIPVLALPPVAAGSGLFVVLVDDDAIVLLGLSATFKNWGYEVLAAGATEQAMAHLLESGRRPDLVVADYRLREGRSGAEAILRVRESYGREVPGIILTGETGSEVQHEAALHGFHVIHKPVTPRQLSEVLERLLMDDR